jgi:hypothetical protein
MPKSVASYLALIVRLPILASIPAMCFRKYLKAVACPVLLLGQSCNAAAQDSPLQPWELDPFYSLKDTRLHDALTTLFNLRPVQTAHSIAEEKRMKVALFNLPPNRDAIVVVLAAAAASPFSEFPEIVQYTMIRAVEAAVVSASAVHVPRLKQLAHNADKRLRDAVASGNALNDSPAPSIEVLKESLLASEEHLPASLKNIQDPRVLDEFEDRLRSYTTWASASQRAEISPMVERFLTRYNDSRVEKYYGPRMREWVQIGAYQSHLLHSGSEVPLSLAMNSATLWVLGVLVPLAAWSVIVWIKRRK